MRKEDRVRATQQSSDEPRTHESKPEPPRRETERMRGSATDESRKPQRPQGRLPLPD